MARGDWVSGGPCGYPDPALCDAGSPRYSHHSLLDTWAPKDLNLVEVGALDTQISFRKELRNGRIGTAGRHRARLLLLAGRRWKRAALRTGHGGSGDLRMTAQFNPARNAHYELLSARSQRKSFPPAPKGATVPRNQWFHDQGGRRHLCQGGPEGSLTPSDLPNPPWSGFLS